MDGWTDDFVFVATTTSKACSVMEPQPYYDHMLMSNDLNLPPSRVPHLSVSDSPFLSFSLMNTEQRIQYSEHMHAEEYTETHTHT